MTDISEVLSAIKRGELILEKTLNELNTVFSTVNKDIEDMKQPIQELIEFEKRQNNEISNYESSNLALTQEINSFKEEKATNERTLQDTQNNLAETTEKRAKLETKKRDALTELSNNEKKLDTAKAELTMEKELEQKIIAEKSQIIESTEQKVIDIEKQAETEKNLLKKAEGERMALEYLIKRGHIEFNEIKIISSLEGRKNTDMTTISKVTGLSESLIAKTLEGLMKRGLLSYDDSTGAIAITGNLKL